MDDDATLTTAQAAAMLGVAPNSVILWADAGILTSWRTPGGHRRITLASVQAMLDKRQARDAAHRSRPLRLLVVEDDPAMAELLVGQIGEVVPQARVDVVGDGFVALVRAGQESPDVIVMDIHLPGMNGLAMIQSLRAQAGTRGLRFILVSSYKAHELGPFGERPADVPFLSKPVSLEALREAIGQVLAG